MREKEQQVHKKREMSTKNILDSVPTIKTQTVEEVIQKKSVMLKQGGQENNVFSSVIPAQSLNHSSLELLNNSKNKKSTNNLYQAYQKQLGETQKYHWQESIAEIIRSDQQKRTVEPVRRISSINESGEKPLQLKSISFGQQKTVQNTPKPQCLPSITSTENKLGSKEVGPVGTNIASTIYSRSPSQVNHFKSASTPQNEHDAGHLKFGAKGNYRLVTVDTNGRESIELRQHRSSKDGSAFKVSGSGLTNYSQNKFNNRQYVNSIKKGGRIEQSQTTIVKQNNDSFMATGVSISKSVKVPENVYRQK